MGSSGVTTETAAYIYERADGMIVRLLVYTDIDHARAAAERLAASRE